MSIDVTVVNGFNKEIYDRDLAKFSVDFAVREGAILKSKVFHSGAYISLITTWLDKYIVFPGANESALISTLIYPLVFELRKKVNVKDEKKNMIVTVKIFCKREDLCWNAKGKIGKGGEKSYFERGKLSNTYFKK